MELPLVRRPPEFIPFLNAPTVDDLDQLESDFAVLGVPHGVPYGTSGITGSSASAPAAIRAASARYGFGGFIDHYDFDLGGPLLGAGDHTVVDCGDVPGDASDVPGNMSRVTEAVQRILEKGALPIVLGGDDSVPIPVFRALEGRGEFTLIQIDAHIDWRDEVGGVTEGYSSTMRRASEMPWITDIVQIGMRGVGSARQRELDDALAYGAQIITAREFHENSVQSVLERIPAGREYLITVDCDGLDPSIMPAVGAPVPGGLTFNQVATILRALPGRGRVAGFDLVELTPHRDHADLSAITACRLICNLIGAVVRTDEQTA